MRLSLILWVPLLCAVALRAEPYALGADISWIQQREAEGVKYAHNGQAKDMLDILKEHKFNYIRLRLFVDPTAGVPEDSARAKAEANGGTPWFASPYSAKGYCGLDSTIKFAKRVKNAGFKFLLDFHYSDTWADPGKQYKPMSWRGLNSTQLTEKVRSYTKESLQKFKDNDVLPDMVQVGNEVVGGMIHPDGQNNSQNFAALVNAGINGVKDVDANILIMMHTISERNPNSWLTTLKSNLNKVEANAANRIDVVGLSYYPRWHGDLDSLGRILSAISRNHDIKIAVAEYADKHREVNDLVFALPENKRFGTFVWEPQEFSGDNSLPLFDWKNNRRETNSRIALYPIMAEDYGIGNTTNIVGNQRQLKTDKATRDNIQISRGGVIKYNLNESGTVTIYTIQGRIVGKFNVRSSGVYDPARFLKTPLRPGAYIITVEPENGAKKIFNSGIVR